MILAYKQKKWLFLFLKIISKKMKTFSNISQEETEINETEDEYNESKELIDNSNNQSKEKGIKELLSKKNNNDITIKCLQEDKSK